MNKTWYKVASLAAAFALAFTVTAGTSRDKVTYYEKGKCTNLSVYTHPKCPILY